MATRWDKIPDAVQNTEWSSSLLSPGPKNAADEHQIFF